MSPDHGLPPAHGSGPSAAASACRLCCSHGHLRHRPRRRPQPVRRPRAATGAPRSPGTDAVAGADDPAAWHPAADGRPGALRRDERAALQGRVGGRASRRPTAAPPPSTALHDPVIGKIAATANAADHRHDAAVNDAALPGRRPPATTAPPWPRCARPTRFVRVPLARAGARSRPTSPAAARSDIAQRQGGRARCALRRHRRRPRRASSSPPASRWSSTRRVVRPLKVVVERLGVAARRRRHRASTAASSALATGDLTVTAEPHTAADRQPGRRRDRRRRARLQRDPGQDRRVAARLRREPRPPRRTDRRRRRRRPARSPPLRSRWRRRPTRPAAPSARSPPP